MTRTFGSLVIAAALAAACVPARAQTLLNLSCMEALASVGEVELAGVFSFIKEDDSTLAFADLAVHRRSVMRRYLDKLKKDLKAAEGISAWDHQVVLHIIEIYGSPLAETLDTPSVGTRQRLQQFSLAPTLTLGEMTARRKKKR